MSRNEERQAEIVNIFKIIKYFFFPSKFFKICMLKTNIKHYLVGFLHGFISLQHEVPFFFFFKLYFISFWPCCMVCGDRPWPGIEPRPMAVKMPSPYTGLPGNSHEELPLPFMAMWVPWWPIFPAFTYLKIPLFHLLFDLFYWSIQLIYSVISAVQQWFSYTQIWYTYFFIFLLWFITKYWI